MPANPPLAAPQRWRLAVECALLFVGVPLAVILLYPLLSAAPQGLVYRVFFFHRYQILFRKPQTMILASAVAFAFSHIVFRNPVPSC